MADSAGQVLLPVSSGHGGLQPASLHAWGRSGEGHPHCQQESTRTWHCGVLWGYRGRGRTQQVGFCSMLWIATRPG